jgi:hypothetical protein
MEWAGSMALRSINDSLFQLTAASTGLGLLVGLEIALLNQGQVDDYPSRKRSGIAFHSALDWLRVVYQFGDLSSQSGAEEIHTMPLRAGTEPHGRSSM